MRGEPSSQEVSQRKENQGEDRAEERTEGIRPTGVDINGLRVIVKKAQGGPPAILGTRTDCPFPN